MNILITGVTETHINHRDRASSTKFISIPAMMRDAYIELGHSVDHRAVTPGEDLSRYGKVFVYLYPLDHNALKTDGVLWALESRYDATICLDDWSFQKILPTWANKIDVGDLVQHKWIVPLFPWGDTKKMGLDVESLTAWDPSPLYVCPPSHHYAWHKRKQEWYNASLSTEAHLWAEAQRLAWPVHAVGGKALGQPRMLESDIVWEYGAYQGILCPTYAHAGCGWWRVRYLHAANTGAVLGGDPSELSIIHVSYSHTLHELEQMGSNDLERIAATQAANLPIASHTDTIVKLESFLK